jgi:hypothetical protein
MHLLQKGWQVVPRTRLEESECHDKKKDEAEAALQAIKERREHTGKGRQATQSEKKAFAAGALVNKGPAAADALVNPVERLHW